MLVNELQELSASGTTSLNTLVSCALHLGINEPVTNKYSMCCHPPATVTPHGWQLSHSAISRYCTAMSALSKRLFELQEAGHAASDQLEDLDRDIREATAYAGAAEK